MLGGGSGVQQHSALSVTPAVCRRGPAWPQFFQMFYMFLGQGPRLSTVGNEPNHQVVWRIFMVHCPEVEVGGPGESAPPPLYPLLTPTSPPCLVIKAVVFLAHGYCITHPVYYSDRQDVRGCLMWPVCQPVWKTYVWSHCWLRPVDHRLIALLAKWDSSYCDYVFGMSRVSKWWWW